LVESTLIRHIISDGGIITKRLQSRRQIVANRKL